MGGEWGKKKKKKKFFFKGNTSAGVPPRFLQPAQGNEKKKQPSLVENQKQSDPEPARNGRRELNMEERSPYFYAGVISPCNRLPNLQKSFAGQVVAPYPAVVDRF